MESHRYPPCSPQAAQPDQAAFQTRRPPTIPVRYCCLIHPTMQQYTASSSLCQCAAGCQPQPHGFRCHSGPFDHRATMRSGASDDSPAPSASIRSLPETRESTVSSGVLLTAHVGPSSALFFRRLERFRDARTPDGPTEIRRVGLPGREGDSLSDRSPQGFGGALVVGGTAVSRFPIGSQGQRLMVRCRGVAMRAEPP
jgi:hypothetical protein